MWELKLIKQNKLNNKIILLKNNQKQKQKQKQ